MNKAVKLLNDIFFAAQQGKPLPLGVRGAEYHLCMSDQNALLFLSYWRFGGKQMPLQVRNAKQGIDDCMVISLQDTDGNALDLLRLAARDLDAKIYGKLEIL